MKVGMSIFMQNTNNQWSDYEVYRNNLKLADLAEPLGFDSIWSVEHHFTPYTMVPDVVQFLTLGRVSSTPEEGLSQEKPGSLWRARYASFMARSLYHQL